MCWLKILFLSIDTFELIDSFFAFNFLLTEGWGFLNATLQDFGKDAFTKFNAPWNLPLKIVPTAFKLVWGGTSFGYMLLHYFSVATHVKICGGE